MGLFDGNNNIISKFKSSDNRLPLEGFYIYILAAVLGYSIADLSVIQLRPDMLPKEAPPVRGKSADRGKIKNMSDYYTILDKNIFNEDGKIPPPLTDDKQPKDGLDQPAVKSQLPIKLLGTIVHFNPQKSVATLQISSQNKAQAFKVEEEVEGMARILEIHRRKIIINNLNMRRKEYIEIPEDAKLTFGFKKQAPQNSGPIKKSGEFDFAIKKTDLNKYLNNLSSVLQDARMVPNKDEFGAIKGFRFMSIKPGSIYEELGFKVGDVITSVNDEPVNSPQRAMELYNALKSENRVNINVERDGRPETFNYTVD